MLSLRISRLRSGKANMSNLVMFWMWWYILITPVIVYWLGLPRIILYLGDGLGVFIGLVLLSDILHSKRKSYVTGFSSLMVICYILFGSASAFINGVSAVHYLWGMRNCLRFFVFFYAVCMYVNLEDFLKTEKVISSIFWLSLPLCIYETFFMSYPTGTIIGDMVGGFYHGFNGVNMPLNIILIAESTKVIAKYFSKQMKLIPMGGTLLAAIVMSALAELKIFIVELIIIVFVLMLLSKINIKTILLVVVVGLLFSTMISMFVVINARGRAFYSDIYTIEGFIEYVTRDTGYNGVGDLNRISGIGVLQNTVFRRNFLQPFIGQGIGSGEYTSFFTTPFFNKYSYFNYMWFQMIWTYIENGFIGIITYMGLVVGQLFATYRGIKDKVLRNFAVTLLVLYPVLFVYNVSLRGETCGFYLFLILAIPSLYKKYLYGTIVSNESKEETVI